MPRYTLIKGEYHIFYPDLPRSGPEPDGDTVAFRPGNAELIRQFPWQGRPPRFNGHNTTSIRFEGIDALETHFKDMHQELRLARAARDLTLQQLGFTGVQFWDDQPNRVRAVDNNPQPGYVLASGLDSNGRTLAFVYAGNTDPDDGSEVFLDASKMEQSVNVALVNAGLAYGEFYTSLPMDLTGRLRELVRESRVSGAGLWAREDINIERSARISDLSTLQTLVLWPKLFRRLADYFAEGHGGLNGFDAWLREDVTHRDDRLLLPTGEFGNMHDIVAIQENDEIKLRYEPEEVVILPDTA
jgi:endonuclease YncB( thermonuclease family)